MRPWEGFSLWDGIRYDRDALDEMLGGRKMGLVRAILDGSKIVQEERDRSCGRRASQGTRREGEAQGQAAEARKVSAAFAQEALPELESLAEIDAISNVDALESIIESVFDASSADPVRAAILTAAKPN